jgi:hypothetical protein
MNTWCHLRDVQGFMVRYCSLAFWTALFLMRAATAQADWVNLTGAEVAPNIAEIYVEDDGVRVALAMRNGPRAYTWPAAGSWIRRPVSKID